MLSLKDKKEISYYIDKTAEEYDTKGYTDLANKIDICCYKFMNAKTDEDIVKVEKDLEKISKECNLRELNDKKAKLEKRKDLLKKIRARKVQTTTEESEINKQRINNKKLSKSKVKSKIKKVLAKRRIKKALRNKDK